MFKIKAKSEKFWKEVRSNPQYRFLIDELFDIYQECAQGEIKDISYDAFMEYHRTGKRNLLENNYYFPRRRRLNVCALLSLIYPDNEEYFNNLLNTIWAICNEYCWALPNHISNSQFEYNDNFIDLMAAETGYALSEIRFLLGDRMGPLINERIHKEIDKRIIQSFLNNTYSWENSDHNWAAVCGGSVGCTFMYECPELFYNVKPRIDSAIGKYLSGFKADGVCREGLGYWQYGFEFFVAYAQQLYESTEGSVNLFENDHVKMIAQFPNNMFLDNGVTVSFADSLPTEKIGLGTMMILKSHYGQLFKEFSNENYFTHDMWGRWCLHISSIVWFEPKKTDIVINSSSYDYMRYMKESQWFVKKNDTYSFAAKGGDNGEPHNHNDIGSFILCHKGRQILVDLGAGEYTKDYFGENRYEILCVRSGGHSVPIIDGYEQATGVEYKAKTNFDERKLIIDLTKAYPQNHVTKIIREFSFTEKRLLLRDLYMFSENCEVIERFVSYIKPQVSEKYIRLADVCLLADFDAWKVNVSEDIHVNHFGIEEKVYLIDFTFRKPESEFWIDFVME